MPITYKTDLRAMLRKFGVVTVMDVKAYQAERYQQDDDTDHKYSKGEWDCKSTFTVPGEEDHVQDFTLPAYDSEQGASNTYELILNKKYTGEASGIAVTDGTSPITGSALNAAKTVLTIDIPSGNAADTPFTATYKAEGVDKAPLFELDTLKIANINSEGPTKSITGGQNADTLLKYGKTFTIEMQDALGRYDVLESIFGVNFSKNHQFASITDRFPAELTIVGSTFVIDQKTGAKQPIKVVLPIFLGDGILNLTQDAEGDASVFDLNGSLLRFNGIDSDGDIVDCGESRFVDGHTIDKMIYAAGQDNEFYFLCTNEGFAKLKEADYAQAYGEELV